MRSALTAAVALLVLPLSAAEPPLPERAVARLGTALFRTSGSSLCLSPDGARAAVLVGDGIDVLNLDTGERVAQIRDAKRLRHPRESRGPTYFTFAFATGGKEVVTATNEDEARVWDAGTGKYLRAVAGPITTDPQTGAKTAARVATVFNCQRADFVVCETTAGWHKLDVRTGTWLRIEGGYDRISSVTADGRWVTDYTDMASVENYVGVTDTKRNKGAYSGASGGDYPFASSASPDGRLVACAVDGPGLQMWEIAGGKEIKLAGVVPKMTHGHPFFTPDGKTLLSFAPASWYDHRTPPHLARWDTKTGERLKDWPLPARVGTWAVDHANNRLVMTAGQCVLRIDFVTGKVTLPPDGFFGWARPALSPDGTRAAGGDAAGALSVWDAPFTGKPRELRADGSAVHDLTFSVDGKTLYAGHADRSVSVWDVASGKPTATLNAPNAALGGDPSRFTQIAVSPDGKTVLAEVEGQRLWAWDVPTAKVLWEQMSDKERSITGCRPVFAPDGAAVYYGRSKGEVGRLDPRTGKELERLALPFELKSWVTRLAVSADGKRLAAHTYYNDGELMVFDIGTKAAVWRRPFKLRDAVGGLAFAPDGLVVTTHADGMVRGWAAKDGAPAFTLRGPDGYVYGLQVSADGRRAVTDAPGATALVWELKK